jgi:hypothetical protein
MEGLVSAENMSPVLDDHQRLVLLRLYQDVFLFIFPIRYAAVHSEPTYLEHSKAPPCNKIIS